METEEPNPETEPEQKTTQANQQSAEGEADEPTSPPVVQPLNAEGGEPQPAESYGKADRKHDETLQSIAEQTEWERKEADALEKQTGLMETQTTWMRRQAIWTAALTVATLGVLVYHGYVMREQSRAADAQTVVMVGQSEAMKAQTDIMRRQLDAMNSDSAQTQQMIDQNRELVAHAGEQSKASKAQAAASVAQVEAARQTAIATGSSARAAERSAVVAAQAFDVGQSPYLVATDPKSVEFRVGEHVTFTVSIQNSGNTPAYGLSVIPYYAFQPTPFTGRLRYVAESPGGNTYSQGMIPAHYGVTYRGRFNFLISEERLAAITSGRALFFAYGRGEYRDGRNKKLPFSYCFMFDTSGGVLSECPDHYRPL